MRVNADPPGDQGVIGGQVRQRGRRREVNRSVFYAVAAQLVRGRLYAERVD